MAVKLAETQDVNEHKCIHEELWEITGRRLNKLEDGQEKQCEINHRLETNQEVMVV